jgi:hypothetical protein
VSSTSEESRKIVETGPQNRSGRQYVFFNVEYTYLVADSDSREAVRDVGTTLEFEVRKK